MGRKRRWTEDGLRHAVANSDGMASMLRLLGLRDKGGNYAHFRGIIRDRRLDTSHWVGQGWHGRRPPVRQWVKHSLSDVLVESSPYRQTHKLKQRLVRAGLIADTCAECGISEWRGRKLSLHLDHANGVRDDNRLTNLRLLCPNCHSLTDTYTGRNIGRYIRAGSVVRERRAEYLWT